MTHVAAIISATLSMEPEHAAMLLRTRNPGPDVAGSVFDSPQTWESLASLDWQPYSHPAIGGPAVGFVANLPGKVGLVALADLDPSTPVVMADGHQTGFLSPVVVGGVRQPVDFTTLLAGPASETDPSLIVWTIHPGAPVRPSSLSVDSMEPGTETTAGEALALGFEFAKIGG